MFVNNRINNNACLVILLAVAFYACRQTGHLANLELQINNSVSKQIKHDKVVINLDTISSFNWEELIIAGPYTDIENIEGYDLSRFPETLKHHDRYVLIGFIKRKVGIKWVFIKRYKLLDQISNKDSQGYQIYKKGDCIFVLSTE